MQKESTLYFNQQKFKFSSGHFTIFSATEREPLHGHNYTVEVTLTASMQEPGITFDYRLFEDVLIKLCKKLNWHCLIPTSSPYLKIEEDGQHYQITFNHESMWLLKSDVVLLPIENITLETLSQWLVDQLKQDAALSEHKIKKLIIKVFNGPCHAAEAACCIS